MSDDEEGVLRIDESPDEDEQPTTISVAPAKVVPMSKKEPEIEVKTETFVKEDGELDEEEVELMDQTEKEKSEDTAVDYSKEPVEKIEKEEKEAEKEEKEKERKSEEPEQKEVIPEKKNENGSMRPPQSVEKTPASHRKRKESTEHFGEKRKSGLETIASSSSSSSGSTTPQRSKRASSAIAKLSISACFDEEDIVAVPMMPIQRTPTETTPQSKRAKLSNASSAREKESSGEQSDASTNVSSTTKGIDTNDLITKEAIMETPPGTKILLELTIMYRTKTSVAFKVKGCDLVGFMGDGLPPMTPAQIAAANNSQPGPSNSKNKKEDGKDGRSSSVTSNGRNARAGSVAREGGSGGKSEKGGGKKDAKRKKEEEREAEDMEEEPVEQHSPIIELHEIDLTQYHDCHYEGCEKRFLLSSELEYHITKNHRLLVKVCEDNCCQTEEDDLEGQEVKEAPQVTFRDASTEIDEDLMPILKKEAPMKTTPVGGHVYEDLSDDDQPVDLLKAASGSAAAASSSAAAALIGIAQASSSATGPSKIGMNTAAMMAAVQQSEKLKQQQQLQQKSAFLTHSPMPTQSSSSNIINPSSTPSQLTMPPPAVLLQAPPHPMHQQYLPPGFHPSLLNHPQMAMIPGMANMAAVVSQQQQQQQQLVAAAHAAAAAASRTPSRQINASDSHKIHELAKAKDAAEQQQRQRQQAGSSGPGGASKPPSNNVGTPQRMILPPNLMPQSAVLNTPQSVQQQQAQQQHQQQQQQQQQQNLMQFQMAQMAQLAQAAQAQRSMTQQDQMMALLMSSVNQFPGLGQPGVFPGAPQQQQQQPPNAPK